MKHYYIIVLLIPSVQCTAWAVLHVQCCVYMMHPIKEELLSSCFQSVATAWRQLQHQTATNKHLRRRFPPVHSRSSSYSLNWNQNQICRLSAFCTGIKISKVPGYRSPKRIAICEVKASTMQLHPSEFLEPRGYFTSTSTMMVLRWFIIQGTTQSLALLMILSRLLVPYRVGKKVMV